MKRLIMALAICLMVAGIAVADLDLSLLPTTNTGVFYNLNDSEFEFISTFKAVGYKGVNLNIGYATEDTLVGSIAYEIINLEKLGVEIPILKDLVVDAGWTIGTKRLFQDHEFVNGPSITLKLQF